MQSIEDKVSQPQIPSVPGLNCPLPGQSTQQAPETAPTPQRAPAVQNLASSPPESATDSQLMEAIANMPKQHQPQVAPARSSADGQQQVVVAPVVLPAVQSNAPPVAQQQAIATGPADVSSRAVLLAAVKHVLDGRSWGDLERLTLRALRRLVVEHLGWHKRERRALECGRRLEFQEVAAEVIAELKQTLAPEVEAKPDWLLVMEDEDAVTAIYLITLAGILPDTVANEQMPLKTLVRMTRDAVRIAALDAISNPIDTRRGGRPSEDKATVDKMAVFLEMPLHFHVAIRLSKRCVFMPFKHALRQRSGLASYWSCTHTELWSAVHYGWYRTDH